MKLLYTGDVLSAQDALDICHIDELVPSSELLVRAQALASRIAKNSPFSQKRIKSLVYNGLGGNIGDHMQRQTQAMAECFASDDHQKGVE